MPQASAQELQSSFQSLCADVPKISCERFRAAAQNSSDLDFVGVHYLDWMRQILEKAGGEAVSGILMFAHKLKEFLPRRLSQISKDELADGVSTAENRHSDDHDRAMA